MRVARLVRLAQQAGGRGWRSSATGIGVVGQENFVDMIGKGWSVTVGD